MANDLHVDAPQGEALIEPDQRFEAPNAAGTRHLTELHEKCLPTSTADLPSPTSVMPSKVSATPPSMFAMRASGRLARVEDILLTDT